MDINDINKARHQAEEMLLEAAALPSEELFHRLHLLVAAALLQHDAMMHGTVATLGKIQPAHCKNCAQDHLRGISALRIIERDIQKLRMASILMDEVTDYEVPDIDALKAAYARLRNRADRQTLEATLRKS